VVDNEVKPSDKRIINSCVIQISISADAYIQKLIDVPRDRLNHLVTIHNEPFQPIRSPGDNLINSYSPVSGQVAQLADNYNDVAYHIPPKVGGFLYDDQHVPTPDYPKDKDVEELRARDLELSQSEAEYDGPGNLKREMNINVITEDTE
jgi:hypothetical protein